MFKHTTILLIASFFLLGACKGSLLIDETDSATNAETANSFVTTTGGGAINYKGEVTLSVPPGSIDNDATVAIEKVSEIPAGEADGFSDFGQAYRFSPPGTKFALNKPAVLTINYDAAAMAAKGLDPRTTQVYYFDEGLGRYVAVASQVDTNRGKVTAQVEHFTVYLPLAKSMVPGNNAPIAALQNPVPNPIRAEAPIYIRATARDFDLGGSVAGVTLYYRKLQPTPGAYVQATMAKEVRPNVLDTYAYLIPASFLTAADLGPGADLEYYVQVTDNLGAVTTTAVQSQDVTRTYVAGSLNINPATQDMTAGFERIFVIRGVDSSATNFNLVPETITATNSIGQVEAPMTNGALFKAETTGVGSLQAGFGAESGAATVTVFNGSLESMQILDENGVPFVGTISFLEGKVYNFDVIGQDAFGNTVMVNPTWLSDPNLGQPITQDAELYTLDGTGFGTITASLGNISATQWIQVKDRSWKKLGGVQNSDDGNRTALAGDVNVMYLAYVDYEGGIHRVFVNKRTAGVWSSVAGLLNVNTGLTATEPDIALSGNTPYVAFRQDINSSPDRHIYVRFFNGVNWQTLGGVSLNIASNDVDRPSIFADGSDIYVAWQENLGSNKQIFVKRHDGTAWAQLGGSLNTDTSKEAINANIVVHNGTPYVSFSEHNGSGIYQAKVKRWNGSSWEQVGANLNNDNAQHAGDTSIVFLEDVPYVAFGENISGGRQVLVKHFDGSSWVQDGSTLNQDPTEQTFEPTVSSNGKTIYVAWRERVGAIYEIQVKHLVGSSWIQTSPFVAQDPAETIANIDIIHRGFTPYVSYREVNGLDRIFTFSLR